MALGLVRHVRSAIAYLNPEEARHDADVPLSISLNAPTPDAMWAMEGYFCPPALSQVRRAEVLDILHSNRAPNIEIYDKSMLCPRDAFVFDIDHPELCVRAILKRKPELSLALSRRVPPFREPVVKEIVTRISKENALFSVATAIPDMVPLISLPWAIGEFASDTAFLTMNQIRMAFLLAAASDHPVGYRDQKAEIGSIIGGAFGLRAIARELVGKIPLGGGLIPKAVIAYAGTRVLGLSLAKLYQFGSRLSREERGTAFEEATVRGRSFVSTLVSKLRGQAVAR